MLGWLFCEFMILKSVLIIFKGLQNNLLTI